MARYRAIYRFAWHKNHVLLAGALETVRSMSEAGFDILLLKGAPLLLRYYRDHGCGRWRMSIS